MIVITALNIVVVIMAYLARVEKHQFMLAWAFALMAIVLGIRYGYGNDFYEYQYFFYHEAMMEDNSEHMELGWLFLNRFFRPLGFPAFVFLLTCIEHFMLYDLIKRHVPSDYYWLTVFIYVFNSDYMLIGLSMMRQFLVQLIGLYAVEFAIKRKFIPFLILVFIGFMIHKIALLILPLFLLSYIKRIRWWMIALLIFLTFYVIKNMGTIIDVVSSMLLESDVKYAESYLSEQVLVEEHSLGMRYIYHYVIYSIVCICNFKHLNSNDRVFAWMVFMGLFFLPFQYIFPMAIRTSWMYTIAELLVFPILLSKERIPAFKYGFPILLVFFTIWLDYRSIFLSEIYGDYYREYKTVFSIL